MVKGRERVAKGGERVCLGIIPDGGRDASLNVVWSVGQDGGREDVSTRSLRGRSRLCTRHPSLGKIRWDGEKKS